MISNNFKNRIHLPSLLTKNFFSQRPDEVSDGTLLYEGSVLPFRFYREGGNGNVYFVYNQETVVGYFVLYLNEVTDIMDSVTE